MTFGEAKLDITLNDVTLAEVDQYDIHVYYLDDTDIPVLSEREPRQTGLLKWFAD